MYILHMYFVPGHAHCPPHTHTHTCTSTHGKVNCELEGERVYWWAVNSLTTPFQAAGHYMSRSRSSAKAVQFKHESEEEEDEEEEQLPSRRMHSFGDAGAIGSGVPAFLAKLWRLVDDADTNRLICWTKVILRRHIVYLPFQGDPPPTSYR